MRPSHYAYQPLVIAAMLMLAGCGTGHMKVAPAIACAPKPVPPEFKSSSTCVKELNGTVEIWSSDGGWKRTYPDSLLTSGSVLRTRANSLVTLAGVSNTFSLVVGPDSEVRFDLLAQNDDRYRDIGVELHLGRGGLLCDVHKLTKKSIFLVTTAVTTNLIRGTSFGLCAAGRLACFSGQIEVLSFGNTRREVNPSQVFFPGENRIGPLPSLMELSMNDLFPKPGRENFKVAVVPDGGVGPVASLPRGEPMRWDKLRQFFHLLCE